MKEAEATHFGSASPLQIEREHEESQTLFVDFRCRRFVGDCGSRPRLAPSQPNTLARFPSRLLFVVALASLELEVEKSS